MSWDEPTQEEYEDAVIEDTVHCARCQRPHVLPDGFHSDGRSICEECAQDEIDELARQRDEAREWVRRMTNEHRTLTCAFCGQAYPPGTPNANDDALAAHVKMCPKHPMRVVERERREWELAALTAARALPRDHPARKKVGETYARLDPNGCLREGI